MKNKKTIIIVATLLVAIIGGVFGYIYYDNNYNMPFTIKEEVTMEYGDKVSEDLNTYIDVTDKEKFKKEDVKLENSTDNMKVGEYNCNIKWRKAEGSTKVIVKDTKKPIIELKENTVKVKYNSKYNLKDNVKKAYDVVDGKLEVKVEGKLDTKKSGDHSFKVIVKDKNGNETTKTFKVNVGKKPTWPKTYSDDTSSITIYKEKFRGTWVYAAHIKFSDYDRLKSTTASGGLETTSSAASRLGSILTINGDYSSDHRGGIVRNGRVLRDLGYCDAAGVYNQNTGVFKYGLNLGGSLTSLVNSGKVTDTMSFCNSSVYIKDGVLSANRWGNSRAQRTFMGTNGNAGDIWLCVSDGRYNDGVSPGLTYRECGEYLQTKGCTFAVPLDGGGSSTMVFEGEVLNAERGHERAVVDFVYFK